MGWDAKNRVLLADDHPFICRAVRALLEHEPDLQVIGEVKDGLQALAEIERLKPDAVIIDITMPGLSGVEVIRRITGQGLSTRIVVLSMHADDYFVSQALNAGASAYVTKSSPPNTLLTALREVIAGRRYLSPSLAQRAIRAYFQQVIYEIIRVAKPFHSGPSPLNQEQNYVSARIAPRYFPVVN